MKYTIQNKTKTLKYGAKKTKTKPTTAVARPQETKLIISQLKLTIPDMKLTTSQTKLTISKLKLTFPETKLTFSKLKLTTSQIKLTISKMKLTTSLKQSQLLLKPTFPPFCSVFIYLVNV